MFKFILCLIIILSCGILGLYKASTFNQRKNELNDLREMFMVMQTEISYMKDPLPLIFERLGNSRNNIAADILCNCTTFMKSRHDMQYCWTTAVDMAVRNSCLTDEDKSVFYDIGVQLGRTNVHGQINLLSMVDEKLKIQLKEAEEQRKTKGRMYASIGFFIGIVIAVIFL